MENTLFCTTRGPAQLVGMQLALAHFGSENLGPNSSMATMESRRGALLWPCPFSRTGAALPLPSSPIPHQFCRISFHADPVASSALLPYNSNHKVFPAVWISHVAAYASAQMFPAPSGAVSLHQPQDLKFPAWAASPAAHLFTKGQHETQPVIQFPHFSAVQLFLLCCSPSRILFFPSTCGFSPYLPRYFGILTVFDVQPLSVQWPLKLQSFLVEL